MEKIHHEQMHAKDKLFIYEDGKFYFSKMTERKLFFILTLIMLLAGILYKFGVL